MCVCVCVSLLAARPADNGQMKAAAEDRTRRRGQVQQGAVIFFSRDTSSRTVVGSLPLPLLPTATGTHSEQTREAETAAGTPFDHRAQQPTHGAPPCLSRSSQLGHRGTALNPPAKINPPRLFMPLPPRAPGAGACRQRGAQVHVFAAAHWATYAPGPFGGTVGRACCLRTKNFIKGAHAKGRRFHRNTAVTFRPPAGGGGTPAPGRNAAPDAGNVPRRVRRSPLACR